MQGLKFGRKRRGSSGSRRKSSRRSGLRFEEEKRGLRRIGGYGKPKHVSITAVLCWIGEIILVCAAAVFLVLAFGHRVSNTGDSMKPVLYNGDVVLVNRVSYRIFAPSRGDIVVYRQNAGSQYSIKRIVGLPGETVQITEGSIYIDGEKMSDDIYAEDIENAGLAAAPVKLEDGEYFVIGDNSGASDDSRSPEIGPIDESDIFGKAWFTVNFGDHFGFI